jgi:hypothetical protein
MEPEEEIIYQQTLAMQISSVVLTSLLCGRYAGMEDPEYMPML